MFLTSMLLGRAVPSFTEHEFAQSFRDESLTRLLKKRGYSQADIDGIFWKNFVDFLRRVWE